MKHKRPLTVLVLVVGVVASLVAGPVAADIVGAPVLEVTPTDSSFVPGEETTLELTVTNSGRVTEGSSDQRLNDRVTTARGLVLTVKRRGAPVTLHSKTRAIGTLPEGAATVGVPMTVHEDAEPGTYDLSVEADYRFTHIIREGADFGDESTLRRTDDFEVTVRIERDASLEVLNVTSRARVGSTGTVALAVENGGTETASDAALTLESRNAGLTFGGSASATRGLGEFRPGEVRTVEYRVTTARSAGPQPYAFDATMGYEDTDGVDRTSQTRTVSVTPLEEQTFAIESAESTVAVGDEGTVTVRMRNEGPIPVTDASVTLASSSPDIRFGESNSITQFTGTWEPGETRTLEYDVTATDGASTRSYALEARVSYRDREGDTETAPVRTLGMTPDPEQAFAIDDVVSRLQVGEEGHIEGTVRNTGDADVRNAVVVFETQKPNVTPLETEAPVGNLAAGESATFRFPVEISEAAQPGPQQYSLVVQYRNRDGDLRTSDTIDVRGEVGPDARVFTLEPNGGTVAPGSSTTLNVTVTNNGDQRLTDISANMFADSPMSVTDDEAFIGSLDPGESETVTFSVGAAGAALTKTYPVSLDFQYDEPDGDTKLSDTYRIAVSVERSERRGSGLPLLPGIGAVLVVAVGGAYLYRRRNG